MIAIDELRRDVTIGVRALRRTPIVTLAAIASMALGTAASTTVYSIVDAALLRPPPFERPSQLAVLYMTVTRRGGAPDESRWSWQRARALASASRSFERVGTVSASVLAFTGDEPQPVNAEFVSSTYLDVLGVRPTAGRAFARTDDDATSVQPVALISERLAGTASVVGRTMMVNGVPLTIVGVLPSGFAGVTGRADLWIPAAMAPRVSFGDYLVTNQNFITVVGRLRSGVTLTKARAELATIGPRIEAAQPRAYARPGDIVAATAVALNDARIDPTTRRPMWLLAGAGACLLALACANVAGLLLGRGTMRRRELAIRTAVGATRGRIVRQLLVEASLLAMGGSALGVLLAATVVGQLPLPGAAWRGRNFYGAIGEFATPRLDVHVLLGALGVCVATVFAFGLFPALQASRADVAGVLKDGARGAGGPMRHRSRQMVVGLETAMAVVLLVAGGLLGASWQRMRATDVGFDPSHLLTFLIRPPEVKYPPAKAPALIARVLEEIAALPGVEAASVDGCAPAGVGCASSTLFIDGREWESADAAPPVLRHYVAPDHFRTLGVRILAGRAFTDADRAGSPRVAIINETAAHRFWPNQNPIGQRVWFGGGSSFDRRDSSAEIVGIAADVAYQALDDHPVQPDFYTPYAQFTYASRTVLVRTHGDPLALVPAIRLAVRRASPELALFDVQPASDVVAGSWTRLSYQARILGAFALAALVLAATGIFAVIVQAIGDRSHEIGVRVALGATGRQVLATVGAHGLRPALTGLCVGMVAAVMVGRVLSAVVFDVHAFDVAILASAVAMVLLVAIVTTLLAARRSLAISAVEALR